MHTHCRRPFDASRNAHASPVISGPRHGIAFANAIDPKKLPLKRRGSLIVSIDPRSRHVRRLDDWPYLIASHCNAVRAAQYRFARVNRRLKCRAGVFRGGARFGDRHRQRDTTQHRRIVDWERYIINKSACVLRMQIVNREGRRIKIRHADNVAPKNRSRSVGFPRVDQRELDTIERCRCWHVPDDQFAPPVNAGRHLLDQRLVDPR